MQGLKQKWQHCQLQLPKKNNKSFSYPIMFLHVQCFYHPTRLKPLPQPGLGHIGIHLLHPHVTDDLIRSFVVPMAPKVNTKTLRFSFPSLKFWLIFGIPIGFWIILVSKTRDLSRWIKNDQNRFSAPAITTGLCCTRQGHSVSFNLEGRIGNCQWRQVSSSWATNWYNKCWVCWLFLPRTTTQSGALGLWSR